MLRFVVDTYHPLHLSFFWIFSLIVFSWSSKHEISTLMNIIFIFECSIKLSIFSSFSPQYFWHNSTLFSLVCSLAKFFVCLSSVVILIPAICFLQKMHSTSEYCHIKFHMQHLINQNRSICLDFPLLIWIFLTKMWFSNHKKFSSIHYLLVHFK